MHLRWRTAHRGGLSSAVLTNNMQLAMRFAMELESGMVHLNGPTVHDEVVAPFGGVKDSGVGREGGRWSIEEMTEVKWVTIQMGKRQYPSKDRVGIFGWPR